MLLRCPDSGGDTLWEPMLGIEQSAIHVYDNQPIAFGKRDR